MDGLASRNIKAGQPILLPYGRVKVAEAAGDALESQLVINLIGERPCGDARASRSLSAYLAYRLSDESVRRAAVAFSGHPDIRYEYTVISNIYDGGPPPVEAGSVIAQQAISILEHKSAGNRLESLAKV